MTLDDVRALALALPGVSEEPHHALTSFRVKGRIFATAPRDDSNLRVMLDDADIDAAVVATTGATELWWGKQRAGVLVALAGAEPDQVRDLLERAWTRRARR